MAKLSLIQREQKREQLCAKFSDKYKHIKEQLSACYAKLLDPKADFDALVAEIETLQGQLEDIPRNGLRRRLRNRCQLTGRARGVYRRFKLGRSMVRKYAMMGMIPGVRKASW